MKLNYHDGYAFLHTLLEEGYSPTVHRRHLFDEHNQPLEEKDWYFEVIVGPVLYEEDVEPLRSVCEEVGASIVLYPTKKIDLAGNETSVIKAMIGYA